MRQKTPLYAWLEPRLVDDCGVYALENTATRRVYVGSCTLKIKKRVGLHSSRLHLGVHPCIAMQEDYDTFGAESFDLHNVFLAHVPISREELYKRERNEIIRSRGTGM